MDNKLPQFWDKGVQVVDGCTKVSAGCKNCWSEAMTARFQRVPEVIKCEPGGKRVFNGKVCFNLHLLEQAAKVKKPTVFAIWNDLYHEGVTDRQIMDALQLMYNGNHGFLYHGTPHTFLIVTKRPERAARFFEAHKLTKGIAPIDHIWHIVTCENQEQADKRIPHLIRIPGKRGIIIEPMLGAVELKFIGCPICGKSEQTWFPNYTFCKACGSQVKSPPELGIHQVILGPENGAGKRPFDPAWAESVKAQCEDVGVPFYRKDKAEGRLAWRKGEQSASG
jgi:protein gp37